MKNSPVHGFLLIGQNGRRYIIDKIIFNAANKPTNIRNTTALIYVLEYIRKLRNENLKKHNKNTKAYNDHEKAIRTIQKLIRSMAFNKTSNTRGISVLKYKHNNNSYNLVGNGINRTLNILPRPKTFTTPAFLPRQLLLKK
jgi:hypothetical protein